MLMYTNEIHEDGYPQAGVVSVIVRGSTRRGEGRLLRADLEGDVT